MKTIKSLSGTEKKPVRIIKIKKLSKAGQWMRDHPGGIGVVTDWRAVNK